MESEVPLEVHWPENVVCELKEYDIEEGNGFRPLPSISKMKAQGPTFWSNFFLSRVFVSSFIASMLLAAKWFNPFSLVGKKKLKLADPFDALDKESLKKLQQKQEDNAEEKDDEDGTASSEAKPQDSGGAQPTGR